jgi:hypothetical protein
MSPRPWDDPALASIEKAVCGSDRRLAALFGMFSRLYAGEEMPAWEQLTCCRRQRLLAALLMVVLVVWRPTVAAAAAAGQNACRAAAAARRAARPRAEARFTGPRRSAQARSE